LTCIFKIFLTAALIENDESFIDDRDAILRELRNKDPYFFQDNLAR
jgi:hypothetical protein